MQISHEDLAAGVRLIRLSGRMDLEGSQSIDLKFTALTPLDRHTVVVDLSAVEFMASLGLSSLVSGARTLGARGGRMLIAGAQGSVAKVLELAKIQQIIPVYEDVAAALAEVGVHKA